LAAGILSVLFSYPRKEREEVRRKERTEKSGSRSPWTED
jgi:hypothetical protein